jgi:uncharacterized protein (TIGR03067 family)
MRVLTRALLAAVILGGVGTVSAGEKAGDADKELAKLQGEWGSYFNNYSHLNGREAVAQPLPTVTKTHRIQGNKWIVLDAKGKTTGVEKTITLDVTKDPKQIRLTSTRKGKGGQEEKVTEPGIYELQGDNLTVYVAEIGGTKPAPKQPLKQGKPVKGVDGIALQYVRIKDK